MKIRICALVVSAGIIAAGAAAAGKTTPAPQTFDDVKKPVQTFMNGLARHDFGMISSAWHSNGRIFVMETMHTIDFLKNIPANVNIEVDTTEVLSVDAMIAVVKVQWRMLMPKTIGYHSSYMNLINLNGEWKIISETDYGDEKPR